MRNYNNRKYAFTLAEVLITLGIIGVVAAITLPVLIQKYQKIVYYNQFKKAATTLEQALKMYEVDNGCEGDIRNCKTKLTAEDISKYFNIAQYITEDNYDSVCKDYSRNMSVMCQNDIGDNVEKYYAFITNDGMLFNFSLDAGFAGGSVVDINGPNKKPNQNGRDIFVYYLPGAHPCDNTISAQNIVWGGNEEKLGCSQNMVNICDVNSDIYNGSGCAAKLLSEGKMNY